MRCRGRVAYEPRCALLLLSEKRIDERRHGVKFKMNGQMPLREKMCRAQEMLGRTLYSLSLVVPMLVILSSPGRGENLQPQHPHRSSGPAEVDREDAKKMIAATVNGVGITMESVEKLVNSMNSQAAHGAAPSRDRAAMRTEALDRLILQELAFQRAKSQGLAPTPQDIDAAIARIKSQVGGEEGFKAFLERGAMTEKDLRQIIETNLAIERILAKEVLKDVSISEDDLKREYEKEKDKLGTPEKIVITDVVFFLDPKSEESVRKAEQVLKELRDEKDNDPLKLSSDGSFIVRELEVKEETDGQLYAAAKKLHPGELSGVVITSDSLHVFKVQENTPAKQMSFASARRSLEKKLRLAAQQQKITEWEKDLKKGAIIEISEPKGRERP
jgi:parvulin-like peptidyl-prolyl isomerase